MERPFLSRFFLLCFILTPVISVHAIVDGSIEMQYFGGTVTGASTGGTSFNPKFSGYIIKPSIHLNYQIATVIFGIGPTISVPNVTNRDLGATTISDSVSAFRYGGEVYARWQISKLLQPFVRFEIGKDKFTETNSGYPTITSGPNAGTVLTSQVAEIKFTYGSIYYVAGLGLQSEILPFIDAFLFVGYTFSGTSVPEVQSFTLDGAPITNYTVNGSFSYTGYQIGAGAMVHF